MPTKPTTSAITAEEARWLAAEHNARPPEIQPWLDHIHGLIREAAGAGQTQIWDPFGGHLGPPPAPAELRAIVVALRDEGYGAGYESDVGGVKSRGLFHIAWG